MWQLSAEASGDAGRVLVVVEVVQDGRARPESLMPGYLIRSFQPSRENGQIRQCTTRT